MNNFQQLQEEEIRRFGKVPPSIKKKIDSNVSMIHYVGDILDLFLPRVFQFLTMMAGGKEENPGKKKNRKYPNK